MSFSQQMDLLTFVACVVGAGFVAVVGLIYNGRK